MMIKTLREKFSAALGENPGATPGQIANAIGYKDGKSLIDRCPDLYSVLVEQRRANRKQRNESLENALKAALLEQPPPTIKAIATQLGLFLDRLSDDSKRQAPSKARRRGNAVQSVKRDGADCRLGRKAYQW